MTNYEFKTNHIWKMTELKSLLRQISHQKSDDLYNSMILFFDTQPKSRKLDVCKSLLEADDRHIAHLLIVAFCYNTSLHLKQSEDEAYEMNLDSAHKQNIEKDLLASLDYDVFEKQLMSICDDFNDDLNLKMNSGISGTD